MLAVVVVVVVSVVIVVAVVVGVVVAVVVELVVVGGGVAGGGNVFWRAEIPANQNWRRSLLGEGVHVRGCRNSSAAEPNWCDAWRCSGP